MLSRRLLLLARSRALNGQSASKAWTAVSKRAGALHTSTRLLEPETVKVPQMAESLTEGTLKTWSKQPGDTVEADEEVATIETDKIDVPVNAPKSGKIVEHLANEEDTVTVGQDLFKIEYGETGGSAAPPPPKEEGGQKETSEKPDETEPKDQQVDKELSGEKKAGQEPPFDPAKSSQTKKEVKEDKPKTTKDSKDSKPASKESKPPSPPPAAGSRNETRVKMNRMRLRIAERLKESQNTAASLTTFNEVDMSALMTLRKKYKDDILKEHGVKLGFMSAFVKASCLVLKEIPAVNASIEGDEIVYRDYVDLSVAVATPKGLVTPVVRNAEGMNFLDIEREIAALGKKARDGKLSIEDMAGGSFTISNGGVFGSLYGTPIINLPQAAVLGMHTIKDKPVVVNGQIVVRPIMIIALTYDHRLLDGREATTFLVRVRDYLEDPAKMLLA